MNRGEKLAMKNVIAWSGPGWYHPLRRDDNAVYWTRIDHKLDDRSRYFQHFPTGFLRG